MKRLFGLTAALSAGILMTACASFPPTPPDQRREAAQAAIGNWTPASRLAANKLISEYGPPDHIEIGRLLWDNRGPWERTAVQDALSYYDSDGGTENLEQSVPYAVPADKEDDLKAFSDHIRVSNGGMRLSARSTSEEENFLTINLATEILKGTRDPRAARLFYKKTLELSAAGKTSRYTRELIYTPEP
jgi:hypothetical protein